MTKPNRIAFFAPIKPPDHPIPSGDRLIAGNLIKALKKARFEVELASKYICYSKRSAIEILQQRKQGAIAEAERIIDRYSKLTPHERPQLWMTYHPYCKAPDWIGPRVSKAFEIPYVTMEAAKTNQGINDEWGPWRREAQAGIKMADRHLCFKPSDREYLTSLLGSEETIFDFPSFIETATLTQDDTQALPPHWDKKTPVLITTGMMRAGKKVRNFELLAEVLNGLGDQNWNLVIVGGGPEEMSIRSLFKEIPADRIHWTGLVEHQEVLSWMRSSDIFIWPGWKEPIGMVYLEAQLQRLPVIASKSMGVPLVVADEKTGLLSPEADVQAMRDNLMSLLKSPSKRKEMGVAAKSNVLAKHSLEAAVERFLEVLDL